MRDKISPSERAFVQMGRGGAFRHSLPIKQRFTAELFEGKPVYRLQNGREIGHDEIDTTSMDRDLWKDIWMNSEHEEHEGLIKAMPGVFVEAKNAKFVQSGHNVITNIGLYTMADAFLQTTPASALNTPTGMKLGTSSTAASALDTDVIAAIAGSFKTYSANYPARTSSTVDFRSFWDTGEATSATINEVVQKSADGTADAVSRIVLTTINKGDNDTLQITLTWDFDAA